MVPLRNLIQLLPRVSTLAQANQRARQLLVALVRTEVLGSKWQGGTEMLKITLISLHKTGGRGNSQNAAPFSAKADGEQLAEGSMMEKSTKAAS